ncbi:MCP four helix bundle domain-containing protein [Roseivirga sp.]|uniref:MCP four helix bundle domain-containing protein n=1 Tax=Roseivirga sp. TaxID=1964215 RepID=UPI003B524E0A
MKWTYGIKQKMTAASVLAVIMVLIIFNNIAERKRYKALEKSITSIYQDRLLVESYIFKLYNNLQLQNDCLLGNSVPHMEGELSSLRAEREQLLTLYANTYLTQEETEHFNALKATLARFDSQSLSTGKAAMNQEAIEHLNALSNIQMDEGASLWNKSESLILGSLTSSQFEIAMVILLGLIIQALIFSSRTLKPKPIEKHNLN